VSSVDHRFRDLIESLDALRVGLVERAVELAIIADDARRGAPRREIAERVDGVARRLALSLESVHRLSGGDITVPIDVEPQK